jgi:hypothetical protein
MVTSSSRTPLCSFELSAIKEHYLLFIIFRHNSPLPKSIFKILSQYSFKIYFLFCILFAYTFRPLSTYKHLFIANLKSSLNHVKLLQIKTPVKSQPQMRSASDRCRKKGIYFSSRRSTAAFSTPNAFL